jgi:hypothetical protein
MLLLMEQCLPAISRGPLSVLVGLALLLHGGDGFAYAPRFHRTSIIKTGTRGDFRFRSTPPSALVSLYNMENIKVNSQIISSNMCYRGRPLSDGVMKRADTKSSNFSAELLTHFAATTAFIALILGRSAMFVLASLCISAFVASTLTVIAWQVISYLFLSGDPKVCPPVTLDSHGRRHTLCIQIAPIIFAHNHRRATTYRHGSRKPQDAQNLDLPIRSIRS